MTPAEANAVRWSLLAMATLAFATGPADVDRWRQDNGRYLDRIRQRYPRLHDLLEEAAAAISGQRRDSDMQRIRERYPHLHALIEQAAGTAVGDSP